MARRAGAGRGLEKWHCCCCSDHKSVRPEPTYISYKYDWSLKATKSRGKEKGVVKCLSEIHSQDDLWVTWTEGVTLVWEFVTVDGEWDSAAECKACYLHFMYIYIYSEGEGEDGVFLSSWLGNTDEMSEQKHSAIPRKQPPSTHTQLKMSTSGEQCICLTVKYSCGKRKRCFVLVWEIGRHVEDTRSHGNNK